MANYGQTSFPSGKSLFGNLALGVLNGYLARRERDFQQQQLQGERDWDMSRLQYENQLAMQRDAAKPAKAEKPIRWVPTTYEEQIKLEEDKARIRAKYAKKGDKDEKPDRQKVVNYLQDYHGIESGQQADPEQFKALVDYGEKYGLAALDQYISENGLPKIKEEPTDENEVFRNSQNMITAWNAWRRNQQTRDERYGTMLTGERIPPIDPRTGQPVDEQLQEAVAEVAARQNLTEDDATPIAIALQASDEIASQVGVDDTVSPLFSAEEVQMAAKSMGIEKMPDHDYSIDELAAFVGSGAIRQDMVVAMIQRILRSRQDDKLRSSYQGALNSYFNK